MAVDVQGKTFKVGQMIAWSEGAGSAAHIEMQYCTKVEGAGVYLAYSKRPVMFPERLCIVGLTTWPNPEM